MCLETNKINQLIDELEKIIRNPHSGLPEEVFLLATRITPMVNVDLLIRNNKNQTLLTWRGGNYYSPGWLIPGGIIRYKENMSDRINHVARTELGVEVEFHAQPILISEIIRSPKILNRGHFISFLFECLIRAQFNRHSNWLQCNAIGGQQWQENDTPKSLKLLRLSKSPKKGIQFQTSPEGSELPLKVFITGEQGTAIMRQSMKPTKLKKAS